MEALDNIKDKIEILAPAGSMSALNAAVCAGANAVYLGSEKFNARQGADNFNLDKLKFACNYAHLHGVSVYLTVNIEIFEEEFNDAANLLYDAAQCGVDAFIIQDIGLAMFASKHFPNTRLHISTQMNIHDEAGLMFAYSLGAKRVTLAREMSVGEIQNLCKIASALDIEIEVFGHGALCICYSGQCLMSSMIGKRSANRGTCAQACRLNYELCGGKWTLGKSCSSKDENRGSYLLSPKDLCSITNLDKLMKCGVCSLKIEGRMKSAEYVYSVVKTYRNAIDKLYKSKKIGDSNVYIKTLNEVFSRGLTSAYLDGLRGNEIMSYKRPNNRGVCIGRVADFSKNKIFIKLKEQIDIGDVLEIWNNKGKSTIKVDKNSCFSANNLTINTFKSTTNYKNIRVNDRVFRIRKASLTFNENFNFPKIPVDFSISLKLGRPFTINCSTVLNSKFYTAEEKGSIAEPSRTKAITKSDVKSHIDRLGNSGFVLNEIKIELDDNIGLGFSQIHKLRAKVLESLRNQIVFSSQKLADINMDKVLNNRMHNNSILSKSKINKEQQVQLCAIASNPINARLCKKMNIDNIYVPILNYKRGWACYNGESSSSVESAGYPNNINFIVPTVLHDKCGRSLENKKDFDFVQYLDNKSKNIKFYCDSLSTVFQVIAKDCVAEIGSHVPVTNLDSVALLDKLGIKTIWLSPELSINQIKDITNRYKNISFGINLICVQELMITEHCHLMSMGECAQNCLECSRRKTKHYLKDRLSYEFPVITDVLGRSHIYNSVKLDICHIVPQLIEVGISKFMIDTTLMSKEEAAQNLGRAKNSIKAYYNHGKNIEKIKSTTMGHIFSEIL